MKLSLAAKHANYEFKNILKHPEQLLLLIGSPLTLIFAFKNNPLIFAFTLGVCTFASSFTSIAINTAFSRRYGTLKYLSTTPLELSGLLLGQSLVGIYLLIFQIPLVLLASVATGVPLAFHTEHFLTIPLQVLLFTLLAFTFSSLLSAEKVLALANIFYIGLIAASFVGLNTEFAAFSPLSGIALTGDKHLMFIVILLIYIGFLGLFLKKQFKWIED